MAKPPDDARDVQHPVGGASCQLHLRGKLWMRIGQSLAGQIDLGWPRSAYDFATVVTLVVRGDKLRATVRLVDEHAASVPGTDIIDRVSFADPPTTRCTTLFVPPGGPTWATLERIGTTSRVLDPSGALRAEIDATPGGLVIRAFDEHGAPVTPQPYLTP